MIECDTSAWTSIQNTRFLKIKDSERSTSRSKTKIGVRPKFNLIFVLEIESNLQFESCHPFNSNFKCLPAFTMASPGYCVISPFSTTSVVPSPSRNHASSGSSASGPAITTPTAFKPLSTDCLTAAPERFRSSRGLNWNAAPSIHDQIVINWNSNMPRFALALRVISVNRRVLTVFKSACRLHRRSYASLQPSNWNC